MRSDCSNCHKKIENLRRYITVRGVVFLCQECRRSYRTYYDERIIREGYPENYRRVLLEDAKTVGVIGKDVPAGYGEDPKIIQKKMEALSKERETALEAAKLRNIRWWELTKVQMGRLYRSLGRKYLKKLRKEGWADESIKAMIDLSVGKK